VASPLPDVASLHPGYRPQFPIVAPQSFMIQGNARPAAGSIERTVRLVSMVSFLREVAILV